MVRRLSQQLLRGKGRKEPGGEGFLWRARKSRRLPWEAEVSGLLLGVVGSRSLQAPWNLENLEFFRGTEMQISSLCNSERVGA